MPERPDRLRGHLRRHGLTYAVAALALSFSPVPSMAADLVTTDDIANGAVSTPKLAADSVVSGKVADESLTGADIKPGSIRGTDLADSVKGAKVIRYDLGPHNFQAAGQLTAQLPGSWNKATVANSSWSVSMYDPAAGAWYSLPGYGANATTNYRVFISRFGQVVVTPVAGVGEAYTDIRVVRIVVPSEPDVPVLKARQVDDDRAEG